MVYTARFQQLLLGWQSLNQSVIHPDPIGFNSPSGTVRSSPSTPYDGLITHDGNSHLITVAPTGAGKNVSSATPNTVTYNGSLVVLDPKNRELTSISARTRRQIGPVFELAPFSDRTDSFNPLDLLRICPDIEVTAQFLADMIAVQATSQRDGEFWSIQGKDLLSALLAATLAEPPQHRNLRTLFQWLYADDVVYKLAVLLDTKGKQLPKMAYDSIASFLQTTDVTRSGILSTAQASLKILNSETMLGATDTSSFDIETFSKGDVPMTIYLQIPAAYLESHALLIKLWVGALMHAITMRQTPPRVKTVFMFDETATLRTFPYLNTMITLLRGLGVVTHTFWQDLSLLKLYYPQWETLLNNCTLQFYGINTYLAAKAISEITGVPAQKLNTLAPDEQLLVINGKPIVARKLNYLNDALFKGLADPNPLYVAPAPAAGK